MVSLDRIARAGAVNAHEETNATQNDAACFIMGFDGTVVTPHIRSLIANYGLGAVLVTEKNIVDAAQLTKLIKDLQLIALESGHQHPLLIAIDQENGPVNSIRDSQHIRQFPSAMAMASCNDSKLSHEVAKATAEELACLGVNWVLGPVLDVLNDVRTQPLGVRSAGHDTHEVAKLGKSYVKGYRAGGVANCGKHFPSYGSLSFHGSTLEMPVVAESLDELRRSAFVPVQAAIQNGLDAVLVGACKMLAVEGQHACLSEHLLTQILRRDLGFNGLIMSECLEVESLFETLGVDQAVVMAFQAGCNMLMICKSPDAQLDAISGFRLGVESSILPADIVAQSVSRIGALKSKVTSWDRALAPGGIHRLEELSAQHRMLSKKSYEASVSLIRDRESNIPLQTGLDEHGMLLLLTPLVEPLNGSHSHSCHHSEVKSPESRNTTFSPSALPNSHYLPGEDTFQSLGLKLSQVWIGKVSHSTYTATGLRPVHEQLIASADKVIIVTADSVRNTSQYGFAKCVAALCGSGNIGVRSRKIPCITVAMGSPYDFLHDESIGTYICTYDFTEPAIDALQSLLFESPSDSAPSGRSHKIASTTGSKCSAPKPLWLAQPFDETRDKEELEDLLVRISASVPCDNRTGPDFRQSCWQDLLSTPDNWIMSKHFVVRNSSTGVLYGFCSASIIPSLKRGCLNMVAVDPNQRRKGIGRSLLSRSMRYFLNEAGLVQTIQIGGMLPSSLPTRNSDQGHEILLHLANEFAQQSELRLGCSSSTQVLQLPDLLSWTPSHTIANAVRANGLTFGRALAVDQNHLHHHIRRCCQVKGSSKSLLSCLDYMLRLYDLAAKDEASCNTILAYAPDKSIMASCLVYSGTSTIAQYIPTSNSSAAGMVGLLVNPLNRQLEAVNGMIMIAANHLKQKAMHSVNLVLDDDLDIATGLGRIGFEELGTESISVYDVQ